jgi:hypothetical protein
MSKTMRMFVFASFASVLALATGAHGNSTFAQEENREKKVVTATFGGPGSGAIRNDLLERVQERASRAGIGAVKNAPFSGEMVCECMETLADGNRTLHQTKTIIHRDGEGRIRQEISFKIRNVSSGAYEEHKAIRVSDHFGGQNFTLDPQNRTARKSATLPEQEIKGLMAIEPVGIVVASNGAAIGPGNACGLGRFGLNPEIKSEALGSQMIEGIAADGMRITYTIPAGSMGNERPIEVTYDRWRSKELEMDVLVKSVDPRSGVTTQQMTQISRGEPDATLFEIPSDYTVQELKMRKRQ